MAKFFASGSLVDFILAVIAIEAAAFLLYWRYRREGIAPFDLLPNLCAGAFLLLALRATLAGSDWLVAGGCLAAAGLAHLTDLYRRFRD